MFDKIFEYAGPHKSGIYKATLILLFSVFMGVLPFVMAYQIIAPLIMGNSIDTAYVAIRVAGVLVCLLLQAVFYSFGLDISHKTAYYTLLRLRVALQKRFESMPLGVIEEKGIGTVKKLFVDDVDGLEVLLAHSLPEGIANLMVPLIVYIAMFVIDWKLALMSLASIPIGFAAMMIMYSVGMKQMGAYYQSSQIMNNTIIEYINGMEVVKVFNKDADSYERLKTDITNYRDYTLNWYKACWPWMAVYNSLLPCTIILTLPLGGWFVLKGMSSVPDFILVLCLSLSIGIPLLKSLGFLPTMPQLNYKISALEQVLSANPLQQTEEKFNGKDYSVEFNHVRFGYDVMKPGMQEPERKEVIHGVSFQAKAGEKTALVGESGSGKSTLAKLLIHYYDVNEGSISVGGQDIREMSLVALNEQVSYVAQDQYLFNTSIFENIRIGKPGATDEEVMEAAKKAQCMEFIEKLPNGIWQQAGDAGKMLSGGQRQRISLARAILKNAPIVVLDEATAFADPENEEKMEAAISELVKGKTLFVIAHKLPSIMNADRILVMDKGNLVGMGKHQELLQSCKEYKKLWDAHSESAEWRVQNKKEGM
ncbi:MAG: ABC transporter ATP-binding protein/permease [Clostridium sp.]|nr:ABC transporter ATP-binding protein/permease [Clostridium sp.]